MDEKLQKHGAISWSELLTSDVAAAKSFYGQLFGWEMQDMPMEEMTYTVGDGNTRFMVGNCVMAPSHA